MDPSLTAIRSFEAAARQLSFARAARLLGVQPPAVSRQVAELEKALGANLFVRSKPRLSLTPQGQELYLSVSLGLGEIRRACERVRQRGSESAVRVITSISITSCWLLPRLFEFYQLYPDIDLQLTTRDSTFDLDTRDADIAIVFGYDDLPGIESANIFRESMVPICSPDLLAQDRQFTATELLSQPLLHYVEPTHRNDWRRLLDSSGLSAPVASRGTSFNSYVVYLQAAINGQGIAVGWEYLLDDYFADGSLCRAADLRLVSERGYFCCLTEQGADKPAARRFMEWVCALVTDSLE